MARNGIAASADKASIGTAVIEANSAWYKGSFIPAGEYKLFADYKVSNNKETVKDGKVRKASKGMDGRPGVLTIEMTHIWNNGLATSTRVRVAENVGYTVNLNAPAAAPAAPAAQDVTPEADTAPAEAEQAA